MLILTEFAGEMFRLENSLSNASKSEIGVEASRKRANDPFLFREDSFP
jgi:hypothetical protein